MDASVTQRLGASSSSVDIGGLGGRKKKEFAAERSEKRGGRQRRGVTVPQVPADRYRIVRDLVDRSSNFAAVTGHLER